MIQGKNLSIYQTLDRTQKILELIKNKIIEEAAKSEKRQRRTHLVDSVNQLDILLQQHQPYQKTSVVAVSDQTIWIAMVPTQISET